MKKFLLVFCALAITCTAAVASDIKVVNGDKKFFKNSEPGIIALEFVWDGATYDNKMPLEEHYTDLEHLKQVAWAGFAENFNERCKKNTISNNVSNARYKITVRVINMDSYIKVMGWIPAPATKMWGTFNIVDCKTGQVCVEGNIKEVDGGSNPSPDGTFSDCFEELAKQVAKLK